MCFEWSWSSSGPRRHPHRPGVPGARVLRHLRLVPRRQRGRADEDPAAGHAGAASCAPCHKKQSAARAAGGHKTVSCEVCHAPLLHHVADGKKAGPMPVDKAFTLCARCHRRIQGRPEKFPQVVLEQHVTSRLEGAVCLECHDPHSRSPRSRHGPHHQPPASTNSPAADRPAGDAPPSPIAGSSSHGPQAHRRRRRRPGRARGRRSGEAHHAPPPGGTPTTGRSTAGPTFIDTAKCIAVAPACAPAKQENNVPDGFVRTWVERYIVGPEARTWTRPRAASTASAGADRLHATKAFFVPKMCNHCKETPCVQVCPVGASYRTKDGVVMVDGSPASAAATACRPARTEAASSTRDPYRREVHLVLPPHHQGAEAGLRRGLPHGHRAFGDMLRRTIRAADHRPRAGLDHAGAPAHQPQCFYLNLDMEVR